LYPNGYIITFEVTVMKRNRIGSFIRENRRAAGLTQAEFALRSGLGLRFVRDLEQGKPTVQMDKVNQALAMFGMEAVPGKMIREEETE
jgi:y4mF family transcriptional regulator